MAKKTQAARVDSAAVPRLTFWSTYREELRWSAVLVLLIAVVYGQLSGYAFVDFDDGSMVFENDVVLAGLTWPGLRYAFESFDQGSWHPVTWLSHMTVVQFAGIDAGAHHAVNVALHAMSTVLLLFFLSRLTGEVKPSALAAAAFALHPMHVEVVAWVAQRKEALAALFSFTALMLWVKWVQSESSRWYYGALAAFLLALMSKPTAVTLPFLLILLDIWPLQRQRTETYRRLLLDKVPFLLLSAAISVTTYFGQRWLGAMEDMAHVPFLTRLANVPANYWFYLQKTIWPVNLAVHYPFSGGVPVAETIAGLAAAGAITATAVWQARTSPFLLTGWLWFLGVIVPMSGLVVVGGSVRSDRFTYTAHIGLFLMLFWGVPALLKGRLASSCLSAAGGAIVFLLAVRAYQQTGYWRDSYTLFLHALEATGRNATANHGVARALVRHGRVEEARPYAAEAVRLYPQSSWALMTLADIQFRRNELEECLRTLDRLLAIQPDNGRGHYNRGLALAKLKRHTEAMEAFHAAARGESDDVLKALASFEIGRCLVESGKERESIPHFQRAVEFDPSYYLARKNLAFALVEERRHAEALVQFKMLGAAAGGDEDVRGALRYLASMGFR